ncbi:MAG: sigma-70 family RNA polymerase sigma factor [Planctomycetota bacterium]
MTKRQLEKLLKHETFLKALALRLLRDTARADDVVQETWLVALRSPKSPDEVHRGWLAGIVRNLARRVHRDDARRARRERVAARDDRVKATDELYTQAAVRRRIAQLVLELPEPYREVILLRFYDGLTPHTVAHRLALSSSTVRTRLQRGLQRLRRRLRAEHGDGRALRSSLALIATAALPRRAAAIAVSVKVPAAVLLLAGGALLLGRDPPAPERASHAAASHARTRPAARPPTAHDPATAERPPPAQGGAVVRGVVRLPHGVRRRRVRLTLPRQGHGTVDADRTFEIPVDAGPVGPLALRASHPETEPATVWLPGRYEGNRTVFGPVEIRLRRRALVPEEQLAPVRVRDAAEEAGSFAAASRDVTGAAPAATRGHRRPRLPVRGVVWLPAEVAPDRVLLEVRASEQRCRRARVLPDAHFALHIDAEPWPRTLRVRASHLDTLPAALELTVLVSPATGAPFTEFFELTLRRAETLAGTVTLEDESPADGATVAAFPLADGSPQETPFAATTTDAAGRFELAVEPETAYLVAAAVEGWRPDAATGPAPRLVLRRGASITGTAGPDGTVRAALAAEEAPLLVLEEGVTSLRWREAGVAWQEALARPDAGGRYALGGLEEGAEYDVAIVDTEAHQRVRAPGTADFVVAPATLSLEVRGEGAPLAARVALGERAYQTDADGRLRLELPAVTHAVAVSAPGFVAETRSVRPPVHLTFDLQRPVTLATLAVTLQGTAVPAVCDFRLMRLDLFTALQKSLGIEQGRFIWRDLAPGIYLLQVLAGEDYLPAGTVVTLAAGVVTPTTLHLQRGGRVAVDVRTPEGRPVLAADLWVEGSGVGLWDALRPGATQRTPEGLWLSPRLAPGTYLVAIQPWDPQLAPRTVSVEVRAGQTSRVHVALARVSRPR